MYNIQLLRAERNNTFIGKCETAFLTILSTYRGKKRSCHNAETIPLYWYMYNIQLLHAERNNTFIGKCEPAFLTTCQRRDPDIILVDKRQELGVAGTDLGV